MTLVARIFDFIHIVNDESLVNSPVQNIVQRS